MAKDSLHTGSVIVLWLLTVLMVPTVGASEPIDWQRAQELRRREQRGEALNEQDRAYLERAKQQRRQQAQTPQTPTAREATGLIPITEMKDGLYKEQTGGLYGRGQNVPPASLLKAAREQAALIRPRDAQGDPCETGKIVLISVGMSNTTQEFSLFKQIAEADPNKSPQVLIVDCAQGGMAARQWALPEVVVQQNRPSPWDVMDQRLQQAGVTAAQVQAVWLKQAQIGPAQLGAFPAHCRSLRDDVATILRRLKARFPHLRVAYLSSRIYAGYAGTGLNPEPYAYESAYAVRWLIESQLAGDPSLNWDPAQGEVKAPLLLWGPYLWGDGIRPRQSDRLVWTRADLAADGTHPSPSGRQKVAEMLLTFFQTDPSTMPWFQK